MTARQLTCLTLPSSNSVYLRLKDWIKHYNAIAELNLEKLKLLQRIDFVSNALLQNNHDISSILYKTLIKWRASYNFEENLQQFSIHASGACFLRHYQYACAYYRLAGDQAATINLSDSSDSLFVLLKKIYLSVTYLRSWDNSPEIIKYSLQLYHRINSDKNASSLVNHHLEVLSYFYESMQKLQDKNNVQYLKELSLKTLRNESGNNQHYYDEETNFIFRIEKRRVRASFEERLQSSPVAKYLSIDYTQVICFDDKFCKPIVISPYYKQGDLTQVAKTAFGRANFSQLTCDIFLQITDFCLLLMQEGFYIADIKLKNFLYNDQIIVADRKSITPRQEHDVASLITTPQYAPPEILACYEQTNDYIILNKAKAKKTIVKLELVMAYQIGMALKSFLCGGNELNCLRYVNLSCEINKQDSMGIKLIILADALTRHNPSERLTIKQFKILIDHIFLPHVDFMERFEELTDVPFNRFKKIKISGTPALFNKLLVEYSKLDLEGDIEYELLNKIKANLNNHSSADYKIAELILGMREHYNTLFFSTDNRKSLYKKINQLIDNADKLIYEITLPILKKIYEKTKKIILEEYQFSLDFIRLDTILEHIDDGYLNNRDKQYLIHLMNNYEFQSVSNQNFTVAYRQLKTYIVSYIVNKLTSYNKKQVNFFTKLYCEMSDQALPYCLTKAMLMHEPALALPHLILSKLKPHIRQSLFQNFPALLKALDVIYSDSEVMNNSSYQSLNRLSRLASVSSEEPIEEKEDALSLSLNFFCNFDISSSMSDEKTYENGVPPPIF